MTDGARILVVDDDPAVVELWVEVLEAAGYRVAASTSPVEALRRATDEAFDLVLSDVEMPGMRGTRFLEELLRARPSQLVVLITAFGSIDLAVDALRAGAADFVAKPCSPETLRHVISRVLRERTLRREIVRLRRRDAAPDPEDDPELVAASPEMRRVLELARRVAQASAPVLLQGESGTGKSAVARCIHAWSPRARQSFVAVNSSTLPEQLAEAELFGVRSGAFTDARQDRPGLFQTADGGTLFLDEIGDLGLPVQAKLLRVLETGQVRRVGDTDEDRVDVRLVAASHVDLTEAVERGAFRADLRYRLDVLTITVPPLRDRPEDIPPLVDRWLDRLARRHGREVLGVTAAGWRWLMAWPWTGNVRELVNRLERAIVFTDHDFLGPEDFADPVSRPVRQEDGPGADLARLAARGAPLAVVERAYVQAVLAATGGNKAEAARRLGIDRKTLYRKLDDEEEEAPEG